MVLFLCPIKISKLLCGRAAEGACLFPFLGAEVFTSSAGPDFFAASAAAFAACLRATLS